MTKLLLFMVASVALVGFFFWMALAPEPVFGAVSQPAFGTYSDAYMARKQWRLWKQMCKGSARYQAMWEAHDAGKPNPCTGDRHWVN